MYIRTFTAQDEVLVAAVEVAERNAETTMHNIGTVELVSIQAQTLIDRYTEMGKSYVEYIHVITIAYE